MPFKGRTLQGLPLRFRLKTSAYEVPVSSTLNSRLPPLSSWLPFQLHISSLLLPLLILLELPTPAFSLLQFPYPSCPYSPGLPPPYFPTMGASCRHSYYLLILIVAKFLPSPLDWSATQLFTRPHSIGCENNRHRSITMTLSPKQWSCVLWRTNEIRSF